jgi:REP element-mobilizing transposase RayT
MNQNGEFNMNVKCNYRRRSLRLKDYDYSKAGYYFITICTQDRLHLFGEIVNDEMVLGDAGRMIENWYNELENKFKHIKNHEMIIMTNHIHFIIEIKQTVGADLCVRPNVDDEEACVCQNVDVNKIINMPIKGRHIGLPLRFQPNININPNIGDVVQWYKTMTTNTYIKMVKNGTLLPFNKRVWQRNYYEHVIRDDVDYERVATYTLNNPLTWENDVLSKL